MKKSLLGSGLALFLLLFNINVKAQDDPQWDDTQRSYWAEPFQGVEIISTQDRKAQRAYMYSSKSSSPKPLIVSLHTWSGDYSQKDPIASEVVAREWNYIHPDFRGANNSPEAMGSPLVISDIGDAVHYALEHTDADPEEVHIIGVSGGGYATLLSYMNLDYPVKSFSAWAPISNIEDWYWESVGRKQKYAKDILQALDTDSLITEKASERSPIFDDFPIEKRENAKLYIYEGIHDGYEGSVPITHSINMYNRLVGELKYGVADLDEIMPKAGSDPDLVSEREIIDLVTRRYDPHHDSNQDLFGRDVYLFREYKDIQLTLFDGGHEQIPQALALIPYEPSFSLEANILTLGDSNGAHKGGWVDQLREKLPESNIINISRSGRTIGFDNNDRKELNALRIINGVLDNASQKIAPQGYDYIILNLGTNDTKKVFSDRQDEVVQNFESLLDSILEHPIVREEKTKLIFVSPPPIATKNIIDKYEGSNDRLGELVPQFMEIARAKGFNVLDVYHPLQGILKYYAEDGVHMLPEGQKIIAGRIADKLQSLEQNKR